MKDDLVRLEDTPMGIKRLNHVLYLQRVIIVGVNLSMWVFVSVIARSS